jgi:hypothetical protein
VLGDHIHPGDDNTVGGPGTRIRIRFLPDDFDVVANMRLQVNSAAGDCESLSCAILRYGVITIGPTNASLDAGLVSVAARRVSLSEPQRYQQNR